MSDSKLFIESLDFAINAFGDFTQFYNNEWDSWNEPAKLKEIAEQDPRLGIQTYWKETCEKIQFSSFAGLTRTLGWLKGMKLGIEEDNYLVFASSFRGALESAGDIWYLFSTIPNTLVTYMVDIDSIFKGTYPEKNGLMAEELEKLLIHFSWGRKIKKGEPELHRALFNTTYIDFLDEENKLNLRDLYNELCNISHPAHYTVLGQFQENNGKVSFKDEYNSQWIKYLIEKYGNCYHKVMNNPINICLMSLWCLNQFKQESFYTPIADSFQFDKIPSWVELAEQVEKMKL